MNEQNKNDLIKFWLNVAIYYRQNIPDETIKMYAYDCRDFLIEEIRMAFEKYREMPKKAEFFPIPAVLKNIARPPVDEDAEAQEVVSRIMHCLSPFKSAQDAKEYMGELAWEVVRGLGGWNSFGQSALPDSFKQRDILNMAKSKIVRAHQGRSEERPALPGTDRFQIASQTNQPANSGVSKVLSLASDTLKGKSLGREDGQ